MTTGRKKLNTELLRAVHDQFPDIVWDRMPSTKEEVEALADKVVASIPNIFIDHPDVGACYSTRGLAVWWGVTRPVIYQQRRPGRIVGFKNGAEYAYQALQFGTDSRPVSEVRDVLTKVGVPPSGIDQSAAWLNADLEAGRSPRQMIQGAARHVPAGKPLPKLSQVTLITPPPMMRTHSDESAE